MLADAPVYEYETEKPKSKPPKPKPSKGLFLYRDQHDDKVKDFVSKHLKQ